MAKRQRTIVLDLDDTLLHSWACPDFPKEYGLDQPKYKGKFTTTGPNPVVYSFIADDTHFWGVYRPNLFKFLDYILANFSNVYVWSAGIKPYVETIVENMFKKTGRRMPKIIFSRPQCMISNDGYHHKPLIRVMEDSFLKDVNIKNTIIVDDHTYTFMSNPRNGVLIPGFAPGEENEDEVPSLKELLDRSDDALLKLIKWFKSKEFLQSSDFRLLDKTKIFD